MSRRYDISRLADPWVRANDERDHVTHHAEQSGATRERNHGPRRQTAAQRVLAAARFCALGYGGCTITPTETVRLTNPDGTSRLAAACRTCAIASGGQRA